MRFSVAVLLISLATSCLGADWQLLFDRRSLRGWTGSDGAAAPDGWKVEDGAIVTIPGVATGSDLVSDERFEDFEFVFEFRVAKGGNTGVKYMVNNALRYLSGVAKTSSASGLEFQLADDAAPETSAPESRSGALYGILPVTVSASPAVDQWTAGRLVCRKLACEHWIGGKRVLSFDLRQMKPALSEAALSTRHSLSSSLAAITALRLVDRGRGGGRLALQYHETEVGFRGLKVRKL